MIENGVSSRVFKTSTGLIGLSLVATTLLGKIAIPGTSRELSCSLIVLVLLTAILLLKGEFLLNATALVAFIAFLIIGLVHVVFNNYTQTSQASLVLVGLIQAPLLLRLRGETCDYQPVVLFFANLSAVCALVGIIQVFAQYTLGSDVAFYLDFHLPSDFMVAGFNNLNPLYYDSPIYKPNGVFFLEPSYLNQFLAIGVVAEITTKARRAVLALLATALVLTYSGTGFIMLILVVPYLMMRAGNYRILIIALAVCLILWPLAETFQLGLIFDRAGEFSDDQSSGFARFYGAFLLLGHALSVADGSLYVGRGPGTVFEFENSLSFVSFDPTWAKVIYEYGLLGALVYIIYFALSVGRGRRGLRMAVGFTYFVLGGYLADPMIVTLVATLVVWPGNRVNGGPAQTLVPPHDRSTVARQLEPEEIMTRSG